MANELEATILYSRIKLDDPVSVFMYNLDCESKFCFSPQEVAEVYSSVLDIINELLTGMKEHTFFRDISLVPELVGSYFEGTKIKFPDEFDFLVDVGSATMTSENDAKLFKSGETLLLSHDLSQLSFKSGPTQDDGEVPNMDIAAFFQCANDNTGSLQTLFEVTFRDVYERMCSNCHTVSKMTGSLQVILEQKPFVASPSIKVFMAWYSNAHSKYLGISVDVTPSFRLEIPRNVIATVLPCMDISLLDMCSGEEFSDVILLRLVPKFYDISILCLSLSCSHIETKIIKNIDAVHKKCLRVLKNIVLVNRDCACFESTIPVALRIRFCHRKRNIMSSYALKMALLHHMKSCTEGNAGQCFMSILKYLIQCFENKCLPSVFIPKSNAIKRKEQFHNLKTSFCLFQTLFDGFSEYDYFNYREFLRSFKHRQREIAKKFGWG